MKLLSWNVNGLRSVLKKGFLDFLRRERPDILCLQEIKLQQGQEPQELLIACAKLGYRYEAAYANQPGYSGVAVLTRLDAVAIRHGIGDKQFDSEGRTLLFEYQNFFLLNCYFPNAQPKLVRLDYKIAYNETIMALAVDLTHQKHVIIAGDFNVAHEEIDLANPNENRENPGFSDAERASFGRILQAGPGFVDSFRSRYPGKTGCYSWWTYRANARARNIGWRIDYIISDKAFDRRITDAFILSSVMGSDHCPVGVTIS